MFSIALKMDGLWNSSHSSNTANITSVICNSTTNRGVCAKEEDSSFDRVLVEQIVAIVVPLFFGLIGVLGLVGNSLVVLVVAANPGMRSTTNILIINLAVADLLFVLFCVPFTATDYVLPFWPFGNIWCKVVQYLIIVTACASVYTLVLMSLDRWVSWFFFTFFNYFLFLQWTILFQPNISFISVK